MTESAAVTSFFKNRNIKTGPSSAAKNKRGKQRRTHENSIDIVDYDKASCFLGIIKSKFSEWNAIVIDLRDDSLINCKSRGFNIKFVSVGTPVVFALNGAKNGEILCYYTIDKLTHLCTFFNVNYEKVSNLCGISTTISCVVEEEPEIVITKSSVKKQSGSSSDSLEPNPNHVQSESDEIDSAIEEIDTTTATATATVKEIDYAMLADPIKKKGNKKDQTNRRITDRKKKFNGCGFTYE